MSLARVSPPRSEDVTQPDVPADLRRTDAFGHEDYAAAAGSVLLAAQAPFTLGIFGDWGIGKTTIVHGIRDVVTKGGAAYVEFDVWRYEDDAFRRQFLREVAGQLGKAKQLSRWPWRRGWKHYDPALELRDLEADVPVPEETLHFSPRAFLAAGLQFGIIFLPLWFFLHSSLPNDLWGRTRIPSSSASVAAAVIAGIGFLYTLVNRIFRVDQRYVTIRRIEEPERFEEKFRTLLELTKARRVVIAIDDLDRCKPELVDKFLAMLKTYLEPVTREEIDNCDGNDRRHKRKGADAVFVISADEAAVRRHMIARELESLPRIAVEDEPTPTPAREQQQLREAEYQVDEYLRKFFNAVIRVRPLLPEDIRGFTREQLSEFFAEHMAKDGVTPTSGDPKQPRLSPEDERERLVSMVARALHKNPRRIKQFVHNLDARLRTIKQREASGRIAGGISDDILGVAKIAIIEEEWRDEYDKLETNPRLLPEWQAKAVSDGLPNRELRSFLQFNRDITPRNVEAVVNLKLEKDDLTLPEFGAFRDAVAYGDFRSARDVIARAPLDAQPEYAARLPELLARELERDGFVEARNVLDASLQDPPLGLTDDDAKERMVADALAYAQVVLQFLTLDPRRLFQVSDRLNGDDQRKARKPFLTLTGIPTAPPSMDSVRRVCEELALRVNQLDRDEKRQLEQSITQSQHLRSAWLPLVEADPELLSENAANDAFQALLGGDVDPESPEFRVGMIGISRGLGEQFYEQYLNRLRDFLPTAISESGRLGPFLIATASTLSSMGVALDPAMQSLLATIRSNLQPIVEQLSSDGVKVLLRVAATVDRLTSIGAISAATEGQQLTQEMVDRYPDLVAAALVDDPSVLDGQPLAAVRSRLENIVQTGTPSWPAAVDALISIGDDAARPLAEEALRGHVTAGRTSDAAAGLEQLLLGPHGAEIAAWLEDEALADVLGKVIPDLGTRLVAQLDAGDYSPRVLNILAFLALQWTTLTTEEQGSVGRSIARWLESVPEATQDLGQAVALLPGATVAERRPIVQAFVSAARVASDEGVREVSLDAAAQVAGDSRTLNRLWQRMRPPK